ncbi:MAG: DUF167 domain-containing protein [Patescibacteria group bacterium]
MKIFVTAKPNAREDKVEKIDDTHFVVWTTEPPVKGQANFAIIKLLAEYFGVSRLSIKIISGWTSKQKVVVLN